MANEGRAKVEIVYTPYNVRTLVTLIVHCITCHHYLSSVGYVRLALLVWSAYVALSDYVLFAWLYSVSAALDAVDGLAARALNQCTLSSHW